MASTSPLHQLQHAVVDLAKGAVLHPIGTMGKALSAARGTVAVGSALTHGAVRGAAGAVASRRPSSTPEPVVATAPVEEWPAPVTAIDAEAEATEVEATPADVARTVARKAAAKKAPGKKAPVKKAPGKKAPVKKAPVKKAPATAPARKAAATKTPGRPSSTPSGKLPARARPSVPDQG